MVFEYTTILSLNQVLMRMWHTYMRYNSSGLRFDDGDDDDGDDDDGDDDDGDDDDHHHHHHHHDHHDDHDHDRDYDGDDDDILHLRHICIHVHSTEYAW